MVKNLSQLKKALKKDGTIQILDHCRKNCIGEIRTIKTVNTVGFYSTPPNQDRDIFCDWGKATSWEFNEFNENVASKYDEKEDLIISFKILK